MINKASITINTAGTAILGLVGAGMNMAYKSGDLSRIPLPAVVYIAPWA